MFDPEILAAGRMERAAQQPIVPGLPEAPGIRVAMGLTPAMGEHLRGLADALLVDDFPDATLSRYERELLATGVSAANECFFCMDSHAAHAVAVATHDNESVDAAAQTEAIKTGDAEGLTDKMKRLLTVALNVRELTGDYQKEAADVARALEAGATAGDVQITVSIAAAFSMYNRFVEGFRAATPPTTEAYAMRAGVIAARGYAMPPAS